MIAKEPSLCNHTIIQGFKSKKIAKEPSLCNQKRIVLLPGGGLVVEKESGKSRLDENTLRLKQAARESWVDVSPLFSMRGSWRLADKKETVNHIS